MCEPTLPQHRAYLPPSGYRVGGPRVRVVWNGAELVWISEVREPAPESTDESDGLLPEFSFRGRP